MKKQWIQIHPNDAVAVALEPLGKGQTIVGENFEVTLKEDIPQGHKFTLHPIKKGEALLKYGHPIGGYSGHRFRKLGSYSQYENQTQ